MPLISIYGLPLRNPKTDLGTDGIALFRAISVEGGVCSSVDGQAKLDLVATHTPTLPLGSFISRVNDHLFYTSCLIWINFIAFDTKIWLAQIN